MALPVLQGNPSDHSTESTGLDLWVGITRSTVVSLGTLDGYMYKEFFIIYYRGLRIRRRFLGLKCALVHEDQPTVLSPAADSLAPVYLVISSLFDLLDLSRTKDVLIVMMQHYLQPRGPRKRFHTAVMGTLTLSSKLQSKEYERLHLDIPSLHFRTTWAHQGQSIKSNGACVTFENTTAHLS